MKTLTALLLGLMISSLPRGPISGNQILRRTLPRSLPTMDICTSKIFLSPFWIRSQKSNA